MTPDANEPDDNLQVDDQDGGPGSHSDDGSGGSSNDVASGGDSEAETTATGARDGAGDASDDADAAGG